MTVTELAHAINTTPDRVRYYTKMTFITVRKILIRATKCMLKVPTIDLNLC